MFNKYPSIENSYRDAFVNRCFELDHKHWYVTEKLHGANFSYIFKPDINNKLVLCGLASRNGICDETFYGFHASSHFHLLIDKALKTAECIYALHQNDANISTITIFGELVGNNIQKGIFYSKEKQFYCFDICVTYCELQQYMSLYTRLNACSASGLPHVPVLFEGTLAECLQHTNEYNSLVGISNSYTEENICEGNVIAPSMTLYLPCGSRAIIKNKNQKWSEKASVKKITVPKELNQEVLDIWLMNVNENVVNTIISKYDRDIKNMSKYIQEFNSDMGIEYDNFLDSPLKEERKYLVSQFTLLTKQILFSQI